jgi:hypothetical protein
MKPMMGRKTAVKDMKDDTKRWGSSLLDRGGNSVSSQLECCRENNIPLWWYFLESTLAREDDVRKYYLKNPDKYHSDRMAAEVDSDDKLLPYLDGLHIIFNDSGDLQTPEIEEVAPEDTPLELLDGSTLGTREFTIYVLAEGIETFEKASARLQPSGNFTMQHINRLPELSKVLKSILGLQQPGLHNLILMTPDLNGHYKTSVEDFLRARSEASDNSGMTKIPWASWGKRDDLPSAEFLTREWIETLLQPLPENIDEADLFDNAELQRKYLKVIEQNKKILQQVEDFQLISKNIQNNALVAQTKAVNDAVNKAIQEKEVEFQPVREKLTELSKSLETSQTSLEKTTKQLDTALEHKLSLEKQLEAARSRQEEAEQSAEFNRSEISAYTTKVSLLESQLAGTPEDSEELSKLREEVGTLTDIDRENTLAKEKLQQEIERMAEEYRLVTESSAQLSEQFAQKDTEYKELLTQYQKLEVEFKLKESDIERLTGELGKVNKELIKVGEELSKKDAEIAEKSEETKNLLDGTGSDTDHYTKKVEELQQKYNTISETLLETAETLEKMTLEFERVSSDNTKLSETLVETQEQLRVVSEGLKTREKEFDTRDELLEKTQTTLRDKSEELNKLKIEIARSQAIGEEESFDKAEISRLRAELAAIKASDVTKNLTDQLALRNAEIEKLRKQESKVVDYVHKQIDIDQMPYQIINLKVLNMPLTFPNFLYGFGPYFAERGGFAKILLTPAPDYYSHYVDLLKERGWIELNVKSGGFTNNFKAAVGTNINIVVVDFTLMESQFFKGKHTSLYVAHSAYDLRVFGVTGNYISPEGGDGIIQLKETDQIIKIDDEEILCKFHFRNISKWLER